MSLGVRAIAGHAPLSPEYQRRLGEVHQTDIPPTSHWTHEVYLSTTATQRLPDVLWERSGTRSSLDGLLPPDSITLTIVGMETKPLEKVRSDDTYLTTVPLFTGTLPTDRPIGDAVFGALVEAGVSEREARQLAEHAQLWITDPVAATELAEQGRKAESEEFWQWHRLVREDPEAAGELERQSTVPAHFNRAATNAGGAAAWKLSKTVLALVIGWWALVWLAGLPMMLRRRPVVGIAFEPAPDLSRVAMD